MMTITKLQPSDAGCYIDGHWGHYGMGRLLAFAVEHGWEDEDAIHPPEDLDIMVEVADDAEAWLNENVAPDGYSFGWHDGEFFLWSTEKWQED